ncbi:hypothetical protein M6B38_226485 [Iris pallida]|uniref:Uncharacterized protein n=1 Tax=Iris pallida TaxID=29817 RepID=A0AAX6DUB6_IRIPA|nr:hypothetical protein M6B38_226485 [Iris pallida]
MVWLIPVCLRGKLIQSVILLDLFISTTLLPQSPIVSVVTVITLRRVPYCIVI